MFDFSETGTVIMIITRYMPVRCNGTNMIKYIDMKNTNF
jgi:hypothetical protein